MVLKCMPLCTLNKVPVLHGDILMIGLENGFERKKIIHVSYNSLYRKSTCPMGANQMMRLENGLDNQKIVYLSL